MDDLPGPGWVSGRSSRFVGGEPAPRICGLIPSPRAGRPGRCGPLPATPERAEVAEAAGDGAATPERREAAEAAAATPERAEVAEAAGDDAATGAGAAGVAGAGEEAPGAVEAAG
ncbi:MAG: hypothetical protein N2588_01525 [Rhodovarius sp.]|nr:hypothetical protein [Rhodovarius sp.]